MLQMHLIQALFHILFMEKLNRKIVDFLLKQSRTRKTYNKLTNKKNPVGFARAGFLLA